MNKPRVLHVVDAFLARSEVFVYNYVTHHRRFDAAVLCDRREHPDEFPFPHVLVVPAPRSRRTTAWWTSAAVELATGRSVWHRSALDAVGGFAPAVIHAHFGPNACAILPIAQELDVPLVTSFYGVDICVLPKLPEWRPRYARLFSEGDLFLAEGPEMRRKVVATGCPDARTEIQPIAIVASRYPRWTAAPGSPAALFVGRMVEKKGLVDAIEAVALARRRLPQLGLRVIGDGPELGPARAAAARLGLTDDVTFLGMRPHAEVLSEMTQAHALIHPSLTAADGDGEGGAPTILLEAQAMGLPIVSTRHDDIPNVVGCTDAAVRLCAPRDIQALADALVDVISAGRPSSSAFVMEHHDVRSQIERLETRYMRVLSGRADAKTA